MANFQGILLATLLCTIGCTLAHPVAEEIKSVDTSPIVQTVPAAVQTKPASTQNGDKLRQEGDGDGDSGDGDAETPEFAQVGAQVGQIITGALGGNIGGVFGGATSFIQEEDTKSGVGNILSSIAKPFNQLLISGVMSGQKFFGITNPPTILLSPTTSATPVAEFGTDGAVIPSIQQAQPAIVQQVKTTAAPVPLAPKDSGDDDDDELKIRTLVKS